MLLIKYWLHDGIYSQLTNEDGLRVQSSDVTEPSLTEQVLTSKRLESHLSSPSALLMMQN